MVPNTVTVDKLTINHERQCGYYLLDSSVASISTIARPASAFARSHGSQMATMTPFAAGAEPDARGNTDAAAIVSDGTRNSQMTSLMYSCHPSLQYADAAVSIASAKKLPVRK